MLERGRQRFDVFCAACHGRLGYGQGMVVKRGVKAAASFHEDRLRESPPGYFVDVMKNGFGAMFDLADRLGAEDRWAVAAYLRALQKSQNMRLADVPPAVRARLEEERP